MRFVEAVVANYTVTIRNILVLRVVRYLRVNSMRLNAWMQIQVFIIIDQMIKIYHDYLLELNLSKQ